MRDKRLEFASPCGAGPYPRQKIRSSGAPMIFRVARVGVAPIRTPSVVESKNLFEELAFAEKLLLGS